MGVLGCVFDLDQTVTVGIEPESGLHRPHEGRTYWPLLGVGSTNSDPEEDTGHDYGDEDYRVSNSAGTGAGWAEFHPSEVGRITPTTAPPSGAFRAKTSPPWSSATAATIDNPRPEPGSARASGER